MIMDWKVLQFFRVFEFGGVLWKIDINIYWFHYIKNLFYKMESHLKSTIPTIVEPKKRIIRVKKRQLIKPELNTTSETKLEPRPESAPKPKPKTRIIRVRKQTKSISSTLKQTPQTRDAKRNVVTETTTTTTTTTTRMKCDTDNVSSIERDYLDAMDDKQRQVYEIAKHHLGSSFHLRKSIGFQQYLEKKNSLKCK